MEQAELKYPIKWDNSMNTVLVQELLRFNNLISVIVRSLDNFMKAVNGEIVMSSDLEQLGSSLFYGKIPAKWDSASYPSLKPLGSYVADLLLRLDFLRSWLETTPPAVYWLSGFFFTQAFLTGTVQNYARRHTIPIDMVIFDFKMLSSNPDDYTEQPDDGAYTHGLFIDSARWDGDRQVLADSEPKILFSKAPVMSLSRIL